MPPTSRPDPGTTQERHDRGRALRTRVPRSSHAFHTPSLRRPDPVDIVETQSAERVPELVPIRYARMTESPFRFFRGAAAVMATDLATTPTTGIRTQLCGDAHLLNFRFLASPERHLLFDLNDFDETLPGPWEWDVKRLATSLAIAARAAGLGAGERARITGGAVRSYRTRMREFAGMTNLAVWYAQPDVDVFARRAAGTVDPGMLRRLTGAAARARRRDGLHAMERLTHLDAAGRRRITADPPLLVPLDDLLPSAAARERAAATVRALIDRYAATLRGDRRYLLREYRVADIARKVVGVGSVGTRCWIVLMLGSGPGDPLLLQAKEAGPSVLEPYAGRGTHRNHGARVVAGQQLMQSAGDIFLGHVRSESGLDGERRDFYVRQLRDWKGIARPEEMSPSELAQFAVMCGATLARAHARSGDRFAIAGYLGKGAVFDEAVSAFAESYADQNERDHAALSVAVEEGRVRAAA